MQHLPMTPTKSKTLVDILCDQAERQPDERVFTFLRDRKDETEHLTYAELDQQARAIAGQLQARVKLGDRVLLLHPPGLSFIAAFFGCLYAGMIAVPAYPPHPNKPLHPRLKAIIKNAQPSLALADSTQNLKTKDEVTTTLATIPHLITDKIDSQSIEWHPAQITEAQIAFLQYTSGSTATPKGTIITHSNLTHNLAAIQQAIELQPDDRTGVVWLPPYHDMGLIAGIMSPVYMGRSNILMSPFTFLQNPFCWLEAMSHFKATVSAAPNFAFNLCVERISPEQRSTLDLSFWKAAFVGAEPIRAATLDRFYDAFASTGFRREAFYPCYGLAEGTLIVTGGKISTPPLVEVVDRQRLSENKAVISSISEQSQRMIGCGQSIADHQVAIVNPETRQMCLPQQVGEIWIAGPSVSPGYWNQTEQTEETFQARLIDTDNGPFFRTGDLGFLKDDQLFVTGRIKELIIIRGRNYYPQDLEYSALQSHPALNSQIGAAFSIEITDQEQLVIVCELKRQYRKADVEEVATAIRQAISQDYELEVYAVVLIRFGKMPKTTSGKIQRRACRTAFLEGTLAPIGESIRPLVNEGQATDTSEQNMGAKDKASIEADIQNKLGELLQLPLESIDLDASIQSLGLSSLTAIGLKHHIETRYQVEVPAPLFFEDMSIRELISKILSDLNTNQT